MTPDDQELHDFAASYLKKSGVITSKQLYETLVLKFPNLTEDKFADLIQQLVRRGQIDAYDESPRGSTLQNYLAAWEKSLWFYASIIASVSSALAVYMIPPNSPLLVLRWGLGLLFVLFLPGYVAIQALIPSAELDGLGRLALSVAVSIVLDMLSGLALNYTPWGIRLAPILLLLATLTICLAILGLVRQFEALRRGSRRFTIS
ncbi:MAG: DUF1616 domain-containing protein [Candidatus Bathyarchaeia archaeon]